MKRFSYSLVLLLALLPVKALALNIFACEPEWAALAKEISSPDTRIDTAIHAQQDAHHVQARPSLISRVRQADLVICTGADLEMAWLPVLLEQARNRKLTEQQGLFYASKQVELINQPLNLDRAQGDVHPDGNPHLHLDPHRLLHVAKALAERLALIDPAQAALYQKNMHSFSQRWQQAIVQWQEQAAPLKGMALIVHHDEWPYLLNWLEINQAAELEPKPGLPPTPSHLARLKNTVKQAGVELIIYSPHNSAKASQWLAKNTSACAVQLPYTVGGQKAASDLFALYSHTIEQLLHAREQCANG